MQHQECRQQTSLRERAVVELYPGKSEREVEPQTKGQWQLCDRDPTGTGRQDSEGSHRGCSQGTFGDEVDQHLQRNNCRRQSLGWDQEFSVWLRISLVPLSLSWWDSLWNRCGWALFSVSLQGKCYALQSNAIHVSNLCMNPCPESCVALSYSFFKI